MKNVTFYCTCLLVLFLLGCEKDSMIDSAPEADKAFNLQMNLINDEGEVSTHFITEKPDRKATSIQQSKVNPNDLAIADLVYPSGSAYDFAAVRNAGGINGEWLVNSISVGEVVVKTIDLFVDGNEATIAGIVQEVIVPRAVSVNDILFIKVKDNGEGVETNPDQSSTFLINYPDWQLTYPTVEAFLLDFSSEIVSSDPNFGPFRDIAGQVQVK